MKAISILLTLIWIIALPSLSISDSVDYLYDDSGRLVTVTDTTNNTRLLYHYDKVGNLLSIYKEENVIPGTSAPVLDSIDPDIFLIGETYNVVITGQNLLTTSSITSDNPDVTVKFIAAIDTKIVAVLSIADTASTGQANITVTTSYDSASISINIYSVIMVPKGITSYPLKTESLSVSLAPSAPRDLDVGIYNSSPDVLDTQPVITIPAAGSAGFAVQALKPGAGIIRIGNAESAIYVIGEKEDVITAKPVSVYINLLSGDASSISLPVSVRIEPPLGNITAALPVSVHISALSSDDASVVSQPVSVSVIKAIISDASTSSLPVSIRIEAPEGTASLTSASVSVVIEAPSGASLEESLPVSVYIEPLSGNTTMSAPPVSVYVNTLMGNSLVQSISVSVGKCTDNPVRVVGSTVTYYTTLQAAYNAALDGETIQSQFGTFIENLIFNLNKTVIMEGGYDCGYTAIQGKTLIKGGMTITDGKVNAGNFKVDE